MAVKLVSLMDAPFADLVKVTRNMRPADAEEIHSHRWDNCPVNLAKEVVGAWGGVSWMIYNGEEPVVVIGVTEVWPTVWSAWMFATDSFPRVGVFTTRFAKKRIIPMMRAAGARRCDAVSSERNTVAHHWLESLGASMESKIKSYGKNGENFVVYRLFN